MRIFKSWVKLCMYSKSISTLCLISEIIGPSWKSREGVRGHKFVVIVVSLELTRKVRQRRRQADGRNTAYSRHQTTTPTMQAASKPRTFGLESFLSTSPFEDLSWRGTISVATALLFCVRTYFRIFASLPRGLLRHMHHKWLVGEDLQSLRRYQWIITNCFQNLW